MFFFLVEATFAPAIYSSPEPQPSYSPPAPQPSYSPPASQPSYSPPAPQPSYSPPKPQPGYSPPSDNNDKRQATGFYIGKPPVFTKAVGTPDIWDLFSEEWGLKDNSRRKKRRRRSYKS